MSGQRVGRVGNGRSGGGRSLLEKGLARVFLWLGMANGRTSTILVLCRSSSTCARSARSYSPNLRCRATKSNGNPNRQGEVDFGGFMSSSLPAFHPGFSFTQPLATIATATATANPFFKHVRNMILDRTISGDGEAASERLGSHQRPFRSKSQRARWYVTRLTCKRKVRLNDVYFNHQGK